MGYLYQVARGDAHRIDECDLVDDVTTNEVVESVMIRGARNLISSRGYHSTVRVCI